MAELSGDPATDDASAPRRIAFCITDLDAGGAERALVQIVTRLDRSEWTPAVFCLGPEGGLCDDLRSQGVELKCYGATRFRHLGVFGWLTRELRAFRPALLHGFLFHGNLAGRIAGRRAGVPVIVSNHRVAEREKRWHLRVDRLTRSLVDHHVCVSRGVARHVQRHLRLRPEEITVIPNGVTPAGDPSQAERIRAELGVSQETKVVLAAGRLHPQKGFEILIDAFAAAREQVPGSTHLVIVGSGPEQGKLERQIRRRGLSAHITLAGVRSDLPDLMAAADLFVLSSRWEGMPNVVLEAMAAGLPVVATRVEGVEELITDGIHGLVVSPRSVEELSGAMTLLLVAPTPARELARAAQAHVLKSFTWSRSASEYAALSRRLLSACDSVNA